jgi:hypothetical protein
MTGWYRVESPIPYDHIGDLTLNDRRILHEWADLLDNATCSQIKGASIDDKGGMCASAVITRACMIWGGKVSPDYRNLFDRIQGPIIHRNDESGWSFKQIAQWLRTL